MKYKKQLDKSMDFFLKYYPARIKNVGEDAIAARELVWAFKDARDNAFEKVAEMTAEHLKKNMAISLEIWLSFVFLQAIKTIMLHALVRSASV